MNTPKGLPFRVSASKTLEEAKRLSATERNVMFFAIDSDTIVFNGKEIPNFEGFTIDTTKVNDAESGLTQAELNKKFSKFTGVIFKFKGTVNNNINLPNDAELGDVYNIKNPFTINGLTYGAGTNAVKIDGGWDYSAGGFVEAGPMINGLVKSVDESDYQLELGTHIESAVPTVSVIGKLFGLSYNEQTKKFYNPNNPIGDGIYPSHITNDGLVVYYDKTSPIYEKQRSDNNTELSLRLGTGLASTIRGLELKLGDGFETDFEGKVHINKGAGLTLNLNGSLGVNCDTTSIDTHPIRGSLRVKVDPDGPVVVDNSVNKKGLTIRLGTCMEVDGGHLGVALGDGLMRSSDNKITLSHDIKGLAKTPEGIFAVTLGTGLKFDSSGKITLNLGDGLAFNAQGQIIVEVR